MTFSAGIEAVTPKSGKGEGAGLIELKLSIPHAEFKDSVLAAWLIEAMRPAVLVEVTIEAGLNEEHTRQLRLFEDILTEKAFSSPMTVRIPDSHSERIAKGLRRTAREAGIEIPDGDAPSDAQEGADEPEPVGVGSGA